MSKHEIHRGGAPIGFLTDLDPVEARAVIYLRLWSEGPDTQAQVWNDFATVLGPVQGRQALKSLEALIDLCNRHGRRPLIRHGVSCKCLCADESCFANVVGYASEGAREDALLLACNLVRPDMAGALAGLAEEFGLALKRIALRATGFAETKPAHATLH